MQIALNPSPYNEKLDAVDMKKISIFLLNEVEGAQVTGLTDPEEIIAKMKELFPHAKIVLTLGKDGAMYADAEQKHYQPIFKVEGMPIPDVLKMSAKASSIAVTRAGAVPSIPLRAEVEEALKEA